jgi:hypothetical protein
MGASRKTVDVDLNGELDEAPEQLAIVVQDRQYLSHHSPFRSTRATTQFIFITGTTGSNNTGCASAGIVPGW